MKRIVLVGGGVRSGKSDFALRRAAALGPRRVFVATAQAWDGEMTRRIDAHRRERDASFVTIEEPLALERTIASIDDADVVLVDCLTLWISNMLCAEPATAAATADAADAVLARRFDALVAALDATAASVVLVTNEVGLGIVPENALARRFRDAAGSCHRRLAVRADEVHFAAMGMVMRWKPAPFGPSGERGGLEGLEGLDG